MQKHAYLIMAHNEWSLLCKLLRTLDDPRNDIYIHIDSKADFDPAQVYQPVYSACHYIPRMSVTWGGDTQIKCELALLKVAAPGHYAFYHLISGVDLPLRCQDDIHSFFDARLNENFIKIDTHAVETGSALNRIRRYRFFQNQTGKKSGPVVYMLRQLERVSLVCQRILGVNRLKHCPKKIYKGSNWFSINDAMVQTVLAEEPFIRKYLYHSLASDELFLQTIAMNCSLKDTVANEYMRYIDWDRGAPYTFQSSDFEELMASGAMFARKFSDQVDARITERIVKEVTAHEK